MSEKTRGQNLKDELFYKKKSVFERKSADELAEAMKYAEGYAAWLDQSKTEREAVKAGIALLEKAGYKPYRLGDPVKAGDRFYLNNRGKSLFAVHAGTEPIECGVRICAAHIDSPRLDLKQHPLFENDGFAYFKTHYYGGIRKYQWVTIPLALHGVVTKADGETVDVRIGDEPGDPVLCISDLLPHLAKDQNGRPLGQAFTGEGLNVILGCAGADHWKENAEATADMLNSVQPHLLFIGTLHADKGCQLYYDMQSGVFKECTYGQLLDEQELLIRKLELNDTVYYGSHPSNVVPMEGYLPLHKEEMLDVIQKKRERLHDRLNTYPLRAGEGSIIDR